MTNKQQEKIQSALDASGLTRTAAYQFRRQRGDLRVLISISARVNERVSQVLTHDNPPAHLRPDYFPGHGCPRPMDDDQCASIIEAIQGYQSSLSSRNHQ